MCPYRGLSIAAPQSPCTTQGSIKNMKGIKLSLGFHSHRNCGIPHSNLQGREPWFLSDRHREEKYSLSSKGLYSIYTSVLLKGNVLAYASEPTGTDSWPLRRGKKQYLQAGITVSHVDASQLSVIQS